MRPGRKLPRRKWSPPGTKVLASFICLSATLKSRIVSPFEARNEIDGKPVQVVKPWTRMRRRLCSTICRLYAAALGRPGTRECDRVANGPAEYRPGRASRRGPEIRADLPVAPSPHGSKRAR